MALVSQKLTVSQVILAQGGETSLTQRPPPVTSLAAAPCRTTSASPDRAINSGRFRLARFPFVTGRLALFNPSLLQPQERIRIGDKAAEVIRRQLPQSRQGAYHQGLWIQGTWGFGAFADCPLYPLVGTVFLEEFPQLSRRSRLPCPVTAAAAARTFGAQLVRHHRSTGSWLRFGQQGGLQHRLFLSPQQVDKRHVLVFLSRAKRILANLLCQAGKSTDC
jgi:hypothetical protein